MIHQQPTHDLRAAYRFALVLLICGLAACGGGGNTSVVVNSMPGGELLFPTSGMSFEDSTITVYGSGSAGADDVLVNGASATSDDRFATWRAALALQPGANDIQVEVMSGGVATALDPVLVHQRPELLRFQSFSDVRNSEVIVYDAPSANPLTRINLTDGSRTSLPVPGPFLVGGGGQMVRDWLRNRVILLNSQFAAVDLATGLTQPLPIPGSNGLPVIRVAYDVVNDDCFTLVAGATGSGQPARIYRQKTLGGGPTLYSDFSGQAADPDRFLTSLDFDEVSGRLFAWSRSSESLFEIFPDGSRSLLSAPGGAPLPQTNNSTMTFRVAPGGSQAYVLEDATELIVIDITSGLRSSQSLDPSLNIPMGAMDDQGRLLFGSHGGIPYAFHALVALDPLTLESTDLFSLAPAVLPSVPGKQSGVNIGLDGTRRALLVTGAVGLLAHSDLRTGLTSPLVWPFTDPAGYIGGVIVDEARDRILFHYVNGAAPLRSDFVELNGSGGVPNVLVSTVTQMPPNFVQTQFALDEEAGTIFQQSTMIPPGIISQPLDTEFSRFDAVGNLLGVATINTTYSRSGRMVYLPATGKLYAASSDYTTQFAVIGAVDPSTGVLQVLSPAFSDGIDIEVASVVADEPVANELYFADARHVVAVDLATGTRRVVVDYSQRFPIQYINSLVRDSVTGLFYLSGRGQTFNGILVIDPESGAIAQFAR